MTTTNAVYYMEQEGSHFESALANLWIVADQSNMNILEKAFPDVFEKWDDLYFAQWESLMRGV